MLELTELALTLGTWGAEPPSAERQIEVAEALARWAKRSQVALRIEVYRDRAEDHDALAALVRLQQDGAPVTPVVRIEPRADRLVAVHRDGVREVIFEVPVGRASAAKRFLAGGIQRSLEYAAETAKAVTLAGLKPEIALTDVTRAREADVKALVEGVTRELRPRGMMPRWRLVDSVGFATVTAGSRSARSLAGWVRRLQKWGAAPESISVQASDAFGLALASTLHGCAAGAAPVASLFGLGSGAGWAASELVLAHLLEPWPDLHGLLRLKPLFDPAGVRRDVHRPLSGANAWQVPSGTTPENLENKLDAWVGLDPKTITGDVPIPLLTSLSGHAGMLHLMHRHFPERHFESDSPLTLAVSARFEREFNEGRQQPVSWEELEPRIRATGVLDDVNEEPPPSEE